MLELWNKCSEKLENKLSQEDFNTWIRPLKATQEENTLELLAPNDFILNYKEKKFSEEKQQLDNFCNLFTRYLFNELIVFG